MHNKIIFPKICSIALMVKEMLKAGPLIKILEKNLLVFRYLNHLSKNPKIFQMAQKMREVMNFKVNTSDPY